MRVGGLAADAPTNSDKGSHLGGSVVFIRNESSERAAVCYYLSAHRTAIILASGVTQGGELPVTGPLFLFSILLGPEIGLSPLYGFDAITYSMKNRRCRNGPANIAGQGFLKRTGQVVFCLACLQRELREK